MRLPVFLAWRYLFSRKLPTAVNILTSISIVGIMLGTAALLLVLSVFNGFEGVLKNVFHDFDPALRVVPASGKYFTHSDSLMQALRGQPGVRLVCRALEGRAVLGYAGRQSIVQLKGVDAEYDTLTRIKHRLVDGHFNLKGKQGEEQVVVGAGVAIAAGVNLFDDFEPVRLFTVTDDANLLTAPDQAVSSLSAFPVAVFAVQREYDERYVIGSLALAQTLFKEPNRISAYELALEDEAELEAVKARLEQQLGSGYLVQAWYDQHETMYRILKNEKLAGYLVLTLMLVLSACTIVGSLTMIAIEKRPDLAVMQAMGTQEATLRNLFWAQGLLIGLIAAVLGLGLGWGIALLQQQTGFLQIQGGESFLVQAFPMEPTLEDSALLLLTVLTLAWLSSLYPAWQVSRQTIVEALKA